MLLQQVCIFRIVDSHMKDNPTISMNDALEQCGYTLTQYNRSFNNTNLQRLNKKKELHIQNLSEQGYQCPFCSVLCSDVTTLEVHKRFCDGHNHFAIPKKIGRRRTP